MVVRRGYVTPSFESRPPEARSDRRSGIRMSQHDDVVIDDRYRLIDRVGVGSMGVVYRAEDIALRRLVAIKVIDQTLDTNPATAERLKTEAVALAEIQHHNVVQIYALGRHASSFYLAMEYVHGPNLDEMIEHQTANGEVLELGVVMSILRQVAAGLGAIHARQLVHRDVKPSNVIIDAKTGRPVLIDFGLARRRQPSGIKHSFSGTPAYLAPESASEDAAVTPAVDIYALGCMAFELLTNELPFTGELPMDVVRAHVLETPPSVSSLRPDRASFDEVIARAMAKAPEDRHPSCAAFIADLERAARTPSSRPAPRETLRVLILERDEAMREQLARIVDQTLRGLHMSAEIEGAWSQIEIARRLVRSGADLVVVDEDSLARHERTDPLEAVIHDGHGASAEVVVLQRDYFEHPDRLVKLGAHPTPKPINARLVGSLIARLAPRRRTIPPES
jgi:eukaryotic-like serine/threonine-protein kinase